MSEQRTIEQKFFKRVAPISTGGLSARVDTSRKYVGEWINLGDEYAPNLLSLSPGEALALRDWLNKVLP